MRAFSIATVRRGQDVGYAGPGSRRRRPCTTEKPRLATRGFTRPSCPVAIHSSARRRLARRAWLESCSLPRACSGRPNGDFGFIYWLVSTTGAFTVTLPWAPNLGLSLSFHFDGLALMFATLITGYRRVDRRYAARYLDGHRDAGKFHISLFAFMGAMLGVVLADNVLTLFVFWELTGFTSYLLIGFEYEKPEARASSAAGAAGYRRRRPRSAGGRDSAVERWRHE